MPILTLRGMDDRLATALRDEAHRRKTSMNALVLEWVRLGLGLSERRSRNHDLDTLAGTWSAAEVVEFTEATTDFERIDDALWR